MKHCIACGKLLPEASLFELTSAPASAQDIPDAASVQQDKGVTLQLRQCSGCGLVQFDCDPVPYYRDVIRAGGGSSTMRELRTTQYRHLIETYHLEGKTFFEAGCGQGRVPEILAGVPGGNLRNGAQSRSGGDCAEGGTSCLERISGAGGPAFRSFPGGLHAAGERLECAGEAL